MTSNADHIIERRSLRRKVTFWRVITLVMLALAAVAISGFSGLWSSIESRHASHIARVEISGMILSDEPMLKMLKDIAENEQVKAVILHIDSPGGTTVGGEELFEAIRKVSEKKPVVTTVGTLAASAGYMIAIASDHIVARRSSIVGSIGVLFQFGDVSELLTKIGIKVDEIKSSPLKAEPSPFHPASVEARAMIDRVIQDSYRWFEGLVAERRGMSAEKVHVLADGSIFTGAQALDNGLVDQLGGQDVAMDWLVKERKLDKELSVVDWQPVRPENYIWGSSQAYVWMAQKLGFNNVADSEYLLKLIWQKDLLPRGLQSSMINMKNNQ